MDDEKFIWDDQALKSLSIFPRRTSPILDINPNNYSKLFTMLTCSLCQQLLQTPAYLKCSHRFCKPCLQKYLQQQKKKLCPVQNCGQSLDNQETAYQDKNLQLLMKQLLGDTKRFSMPSQIAPPVQTSLRSSRQRIKPLTTEQGSQSELGIKKTRSNDVDDNKRRKKESNSETGIMTSKKMLRRQKDPDRKQQKQVNITEKQNPEGEQKLIKELIVKKGKKSSKVQVIEIESQSQVQEIPRQQFEYNHDEILYNDLTAIKIIPEVSEIQSTNKLPSVQNLAERSKHEENHEQEQVKQKIEDESRKKQIEEEAIQEEEQKQDINNIEDQKKQKIESAKQLLKKQFGDQYIYKIFQLTSFNICMQIKIARHPINIFTPQITPQHLFLPVKSPLIMIKMLIARSLNINKQALKLFIKIAANNNLIEVSNNLKLDQANQLYWKTFKGLDILEVNSWGDEKYKEEFVKREVDRVLYYAVDYEKIC